MSHFLKLYSFFFICLFLCFSCKNEQKSTSQQTEQATTEEAADRLLPFSTGKINNLYVYYDPSYNKGPFRDSLTYHFDQPYLLVPTPTPVLDLTPYDFDRFANGSARTANNLVVVNLQEDSEISRFVKQQLGDQQISKALGEKNMALVRVRNVNAKPQQVFYLLTKSYPNVSSKAVIDDLKDYIQTIVEESLELDNQRLASSFAQRRTRTMEDRVKEEFGVSIWIPRDYEVMIEKENFLWLLRETPELYSSLIFYKSNQYDEQPLLDRVLPLREDLGKFVETNRENSYMTTHVDSKPYPIQREIEVDGKPVVETRGLWEIENDYLGGGFVNYTLENKRGETVVVDGFVYYSENDVRRQMRDIDALMSTVQIP